MKCDAHLEISIWGKYRFYWKWSISKNKSTWSLLINYLCLSTHSSVTRMRVDPASHLFSFSYLSRLPWLVWAVSFLPPLYLYYLLFLSRLQSTPSCISLFTWSCFIYSPCWSVWFIRLFVAEPSHLFFFGNTFTVLFLILYCIPHL